MNDPSPRLLFVPVSGTYGMGEYARSRAIAEGAERRWPGAAIQFILSREAPYAAQSAFPTTLLPSSPTFHSTAVNEVIQAWRPDVVIFDNAGRTAQLRAAKRAGARVVYISARRRQRKKAFRLRWMQLIDEHWIAYPEFIAGGPGIIERFKLQLLGRPAVRYLDVILARGPGRGADSGAGAEGYALVVPGGGTGHPGAGDAVARFLEASRRLAAAEVDTVFVGREGNAAPGLRMLGSVPQAALAELMRGARLVVANGGSTLLQSIACGKPTIGVPIAGDQGDRIRRCVAAGVAVAAPLDPEAIFRTAIDLWQSDARRGALSRRTEALGLADGVDVAVRAIAGLLVN